jgi:hypothetical protein
MYLLGHYENINELFDDNFCDLKNIQNKMFVYLVL